MTDSERRLAAKQFAADWVGRGDEKQETQTFWIALLQKVFGVEEPDKFISLKCALSLTIPALSTATYAPAFVHGEGVKSHVDLRIMNLIGFKTFSNWIAASLIAYIQPFRYEILQAAVLNDKLKPLCNILPDGHRELRREYDISD